MPCGRQFSKSRKEISSIWGISLRIFAKSNSAQSEIVEKKTISRRMNKYSLGASCEAARKANRNRNFLVLTWVLCGKAEEHGKKVQQDDDGKIVLSSLELQMQMISCWKIRKIRA